MTVGEEVRTLALGDELALPVDAVTRTAAVVGQKGTGKTSTGVVILEEASAAGARFAVMDPTGAWSGLRSSADGEGPGLDCVVMGGFHGDVPLDPGAGEVVARLVVEEGYSVVCDLERMTRSMQVGFVADFSEAALELCRSAVTVVYDEAPRFVPQGGAGIEEEGVRCRVAVTEVVMLGRRKGLGSVLISQRPSKLHKDVLEQADVLVSHRLMGNNDRKAIAGWLEEYGEDAGEWLSRLPKLPRGQAVVLAPEYDLGGVFQIRPKRTYDSSATPDVGAVLLDAPRGRAQIDLGALESKMGHALEAAQENDPEALRRRIRRLEEKLAQQPDDDSVGIAKLEAVVEDREAAIEVLRDRVADLERVARELVDEAPAFDRHARRLHVLARRIGPTPEGEQAPEEGTQEAEHAQEEERDANRREVERAVEAAANYPATQPTRSRTPEGRTEPEAANAPTGENAEAPAIKAGAIRMLAALLDAPRPLTRAELATLSKVRTGGTMSDYLSVLRRRGLIAEEGGAIEIANRHAVYELVGRQRLPRMPEDVAAPHQGDLKAGARRMLELLMRTYPEGYTRKELSGLAAIATGGTFSDYLSSLRRRGLIEERGRRVYAGSILYLWEG